MNFEQPQEDRVVSRIKWAKPDIDYEYGEIERVAEYFGKTAQEKLRIREELSRGAQQAEMIDLTEDLWQELENTDSFDVTPDDYTSIRDCVEACNRNYQARVVPQIKKINSGGNISAPIIARYGGVLHLVAGNTRLMLARAAGQTPKVVIVELSQ